MPYLLWMCVIGLVTGALAKLILSGNDPSGLVLTMLLGIAGSLAAGYIGQALGWYEPGESAGFLMSLFGATLLPVAHRACQRGSA